MNNFFIKLIQQLAVFDNTAIFAVSIVPYSFFLFFLYKIKSINNFIKIGFSLTVLFVIITIIISIYTLTYLDKTLVEVDLLHGSAELFLTISDFVILIGFIQMLKKLEVKNS